MIPSRVLVPLLSVWWLFVVAADPDDGFYPYGPANDDVALPKDDDVSSPEIRLSVPVTFYGEKYNSLYVNTNGLLSFLTDIPQFFSIQFPLNYPVIAPLYSNVDTRGAGNVFYRETHDPALLQQASDNVRHFYPNLELDFNAASIFITTWLEVGYYNYGSDKVNTYQVALISDGEETFVELRYRRGGIQWIQGDSQTSGLPDARAQAGFISADARMYTLRGSGTDQVQNLDRWTNTDKPGFWMFRVGQIAENGNIETPQTTDSEDVNLVDNKSCSVGGTVCHSKAECKDEDSGFCCVCLNGYYGNGRNCLKEGIPLRVNGKVTIDMEGAYSTHVDVQAYIVTTDGRSYTALSKVPPTVGRNLQLVNSVSSVIGWLFAKPINGALNGYQLTGGVLNHSAQITFSDSDKKISVEQRYLGLDIFDQLTMVGKVTGSIPSVPEGHKLTMPDFQQEYRRISPGVIRSQTSEFVKVENTEKEYIVTVDQSIDYHEWCSSVPPEVSPLRLKAARNFISYEERENILRFAATNKISPLSEHEDPCIVGQVNCVNNSVCIVEGDSFRCVCNRGFQTLYADDGSYDYGCVDINECSQGTHTCDVNALCINEVGSFSCQCRPGFTGDGHQCSQIEQTCEGVTCNPGAECVEVPNSAPRCSCLPGYTGNGTVCVDEGDCLECSPNAYCNHTDYGELICTCFPGYKGDGKLCVSDEDTTLRTCMFNSCWCPPGYTEHGDICHRSSPNPYTESSAESADLEQRPLPDCYNDICLCPRGYDLINDICEPQPGFSLPTKGVSGASKPKSHNCNIVNLCHPHAQCVLIRDNEYRCECNAGYKGDGYECTELELSCLEADICHLYASCISDQDSGRGTCVCDAGYEGDGFHCHRADECGENSDCPENAACIWSGESQRKECVCNMGYVLDYNICVKEGCDPECHEFAECITNPHTGTPQCVCRPGFTGDGINDCEEQPAGCNVLNNCHSDADCVYNSDESGYRCQCREGFEGDGLECKVVATCHTNLTACSKDAACVRTHTGYECQCHPGFVGNGYICKAIRQQEGGFLLVNKGMATLRIPLVKSNGNIGRPIQFQFDQIAIGITVDCAEGRVYWSDIAGQVIKSSFYDGKDVVKFITSQISSPEGLAVDWVNRNLYWTDSGSDTIKVANLDTAETRSIITTGLVNPRGIAVHPGYRKLFWSDWNRAGPKLESSDLDGNGRTVLISGESVQLPNSLAIDWNTNEVCWTDAGTKNIECIGIDIGSRRRVVSNCSYPFGLTITSDRYYWTDWNTQKVESVWKNSGTPAESIAVPLGGAGKLYGIASVEDNCPLV